MTTPGYRWWVGDLRTGKLIREVDLQNFKWSTDIHAVGSMDGEFPLRSMEWPFVKSDTAAPKAYLAVAYEDRKGHETFLEAGPLTPGEFDDESGVLKVSAAGLSSYYNRRKLLPPLAPGVNPADVVVSYEANQLGLIEKRLIQLAHSHLGGAMPVVLPDDEDLGGAGSVHIRNYPGYELAWIGERLKQMSEVIDGAEFQFVPCRRADDDTYLEWAMLIGTEATDYLVTQDGDPWTFDRATPKSPVAAITVDPDSSSKTYRSFAAGIGDAEGRLIAWDEDLTQVIENGYALVESEVSSTDTVECISTLHAHTEDDLRTNAHPFDYWTVKVDRDANPNVGQYRPGDWCRVRVKDHFYINDGEHNMRIVQMSGDTSKFVELQMAPVLGEEASSTGPFGPEGYQFTGYGYGPYGFGPYGG